MIKVGTDIGRSCRDTFQLFYYYYLYYFFNNEYGALSGLRHIISASMGIARAVSLLYHEDLQVNGTPQ